jgi:low temperature requirement protein LtrA
LHKTTKNNLDKQALQNNTISSMASAALGRFFNNFFQKTPWFVSPVRVPCESCAKYEPPYSRSTECENFGRHDYTCAAKAAKQAEQLPRFEKHEEPSSIQLFYDLFFVANLSACTKNHQIVDGSSLAAYIGFFTLMWFTWFGTILFDVRFAMDSWFIRLGKACSFGIMTVFALSSIYFDNPDGDAHFGHDAQMISLILMASRVFLVIEYGAILIAAYYRCWNKSVVMPFALTISTSLIAAFVFLGLSFDKSVENISYGNIGWYVTLPPVPTGKSRMLTQPRYITSILEAATLLIISYFHPTMFLNKTNIVERMGALTLIIMGEGIIGMTEAVSNMFSTSSQISNETAGLVVAVVLIIYVLWMLYFDHADKLDHPGGRINKQGPWCQIWIFLHFPLHIAILLTLEASAKFTLWWNANEAFNYIIETFYRNSSYYPDVQSGPQLFQALQYVLANITSKYPLLREDIKNDVDFQHNLTTALNLGPLNGSSENDKTLDNLLNDMSDNALFLVCGRLDIEVPKMSDNPGDNVLAIFDVFFEWFGTFFVAAGCVLILLAFTRYVGHQETVYQNVAGKETRHMKKIHPVAWVAIRVQCLIGIGLALVAILELPSYSDGFDNFIQSPWIIPTVLLAFCLGKSFPAIEICAWLTFSP